ncbi:MAG: pallilysin-related adhesin, partial [Spirochaetaceae bacterium]|nr:pallilysin-related adhesin [Spirochaetaceae bacterium]
SAAESERIKVSLDDGEIAVALLSEDFDKDGSEEQVIAYRNLLKENNPIYLTYIDYQEDKKLYKRVWSGPSAVVRPGTVSLFTQDLTGDRSACIILTGMNGKGEHTMAVFRVTKNDQDDGALIGKIADIKIDGTISIIETERTQAYQMGLTRGASFEIKGRGRDTSSSNEFDQIEITYSYNPDLGRYVQKKVDRIPGARAEGAQFSRLLSGSAAEFEQFISGLWYRVAPDMSVNNSQYIYFDTGGREIIFYDKSTQQVYKWLSSTSTRYGLYISSQNISVITLRRVMDIELESIDSIRVKVFEDVRMKIALSAPWDGSYRKSPASIKSGEAAALPIKPYIDGTYNGPFGGITFSSNGEYVFNVSGKTQSGRYTFFTLDRQEYLELLPEGGQTLPAGVKMSADGKKVREVYRVVRPVQAETDGESFSLQRVRLGAGGIQEFHEDPIAFSLSP